MVNDSRPRVADEDGWMYPAVVELRDGKGPDYEKCYCSGYPYPCWLPENVHLELPSDEAADAFLAGAEEWRHPVYAHLAKDGRSYEVCHAASHVDCPVNEHPHRVFRSMDEFQRVWGWAQPVAAHLQNGKGPAFVMCGDGYACQYPAEAHRVFRTRLALAQYDALTLLNAWQYLPAELVAKLRSQQVIELDPSSSEERRNYEDAASHGASDAIARTVSQLDQTALADYAPTISKRADDLKDIAASVAFGGETDEEPDEARRILERWLGSVSALDSLHDPHDQGYPLMVKYHDEALRSIAYALASKLGISVPEPEAAAVTAEAEDRFLASIAKHVEAADALGVPVDDVLRNADRDSLKYHNRYKVEAGPLLDDSTPSIPLWDSYTDLWRALGEKQARMYDVHGISILTPDGTIDTNPAAITGRFIANQFQSDPSGYLPGLIRDDFSYDFGDDELYDAYARAVGADEPESSAQRNAAAHELALLLTTRARLYVNAATTDEK
ncbi:hypothetical protein EMO89_00435 [Bifidobacterium tissieri]|uniref:Uncharacterized protein n=1 Tax=Bifidobacterium tissieri TaxID=1630162 RepID=A0A5M9ZWS2_9BIFI|nr:hypothetical protein [Bifidobacterium tissieri]KAA8832030.1 hypothetical protein EMO89_00435 [Bifidobacterium tissieri]